jgi:hypothetical protein
MYIVNGDIYGVSISYVTGVENAEDVPRTFTLKQNYPNPFNPSTTISFSLPQREHVTLKIFDVLGRGVATLVDGEMEAGEHSVNFNAEWIPNGVYFAQMKGGNKVQRIKMVSVK